MAHGLAANNYSLSKIQLYFSVMLHWKSKYNSRNGTSELFYLNNFLIFCQRMMHSCLSGRNWQNIFFIAKNWHALPDKHLYIILLLFSLLSSWFTIKIKSRLSNKKNWSIQIIPFSFIKMIWTFSSPFFHVYAFLMKSNSPKYQRNISFSFYKVFLCFYHWIHCWGRNIERKREKSKWENECELEMNYECFVPGLPVSIWFVSNIYFNFKYKPNQIKPMWKRWTRERERVRKETPPSVWLTMYMCVVRVVCTDTVQTDIIGIKYGMKKYVNLLLLSHFAGQQTCLLHDVNVALCCCCCCFCFLFALKFNPNA